MKLEWDAKCKQCLKPIPKGAYSFHSLDEFTHFDSIECYEQWISEDRVAQNWLDKWYPKYGTCLMEGDRNFGKSRRQIVLLSISKQYLTGFLDLSDFVNLEIFDCSDNQLTSLNLSENNQLTWLDCHSNQLTSLNLSENKQLKVLRYSDNPFTVFSFLFQLNPEQLESLSLDKNSKEELSKQKYPWEGKIIYERKGIINLTNQISSITLLSRYQKAQANLFSSSQKQQLENKLAELEEQLQELRSFQEKLTKRNEHLEILIAESEYQISLEKNSITDSFLSSFSEIEEAHCQELIKLHEQWFLANSAENYVLSLNLKYKLRELEDALKEKLGINFSQMMEMILSKFNNLYQYKLILEKQLKEKSNIPSLQEQLKEMQAQLETGISEIKTSLLQKEFQSVQYKISKLEQVFNQGIISSGSVSILGNASFSHNQICSSDKFEELFETTLVRSTFEE